MKILVVDDVAIVRGPIAAALQGAGHQAVAVASGREALSHLKSEKPDLMLLDIMLPDMSGLQILRAVRNSPATANLPVILLTGEETREIVIAAAKLGAQGYVLKSRFSLPELLARVQRFDPKGDAAASR
jgi:DNA-binding response OmpR family regulator